MEKVRIKMEKNIIEIMESGTKESRMILDRNKYYFVTKSDAARLVKLKYAIESQEDLDVHTEEKIEKEKKQSVLTSKELKPSKETKSSK